LWINPHKQKPDDIRMQLLLILLQEGMIGEETTRHALELWAVGYLRRHFAVYRITPLMRCFSDSNGNSCSLKIGERSSSTPSRSCVESWLRNVRSEPGEGMLARRIDQSRKSLPI